MHIYFSTDKSFQAMSMPFVFINIFVTDGFWYIYIYI